MSEKIPTGWETKKIEDICEILDNLRVPINSENRLKKIGTIPYYGANGLQGYINDYIFNEPLILMAEDGGNFDDFYNKPIAYRIYGKSWVNNHAHVLRAKEKYNQNFIFYSLVNKDIRPYIFGGTRTKLNQKELRNILINIPTALPEQKAIADVLSDTDELITSLEKLINKKKNIKKGTMQELLTGKRRLPGFTEPWETKKLGEIAEIGRGRVISHKEIRLSVSKKYPVFSSQTINKGVMGYLDTHDFEGDYITWTTDGVNAGKVFYRKGKFNCTNVCGTIKLKYQNSYLFISYLLDTLTHRYVSKNLANPKIMNNVVKKISVCLPTFSEQKAIASILSDMDNEIENLENKLDKYKKIKKGMMHQLLTGKIRIVKENKECLESQMKEQHKTV